MKKSNFKMLVSVITDGARNVCVETGKNISL